MRWILSLCLAAIVAPQALGQLTGITCNQPNRVIGESVTFSATGTVYPGYFPSYQWWSRYSENQPEVGDSGDPLPWAQHSSTTNGMSTYAPTPGRWDVKVTVSYTPMMPGDPPKPPETEEETFVFPIPDNFVITSGLNSPTLLENPIEVRYEVRTGSKAIGMMAVGWGEGRDMNQKRIPPYPPNEPENLPNSTWYMLSRYGAILVDPSRSNPQDYIDQYLRYMSPQRYWTWDQYVLWSWETPRNVTKSSELGSVSLERHKIDATRWEVRD